MSPPASPWRIQRLVLAAVAVVDLLSFLLFLGDARASALAADRVTAFSGLVSHPLVAWPVVLAGVAGAIAFAAGAGRLGAGLVPLAALSMLSTAHAQLFGSPWRHLFYSGLCLAGWLIGLAVSRRRGTPADESFARLGSTALLGAGYLNAGLSKLAFAGGAWLSGLPVQAAVVAQDGLVADSVLTAYRVWAVNTPAVIALFAVLTVVFELAGPLMIINRRIRLVVAGGLIAMHVNIFLMTTHILYWESVVLLVTFALAADGPGTEPVQTRTSRYPAWFLAAVVVLGLWAGLAVRHQASRHARRQAEIAAQAAQAQQPVPNRQAAPDQVQPPAVPPPTVVVPPTPVPLQRVGPFAVGDPIVAPWSIDSLRITDGGFIVALAGGPGTLSFEITCADSPHRSPFDLDAAHIFYSTDQPFPAIDAAGKAVRERVSAAVGDAAPCDQVATWRNAVTR